ncbi:hypothetical protein ACO0K0_16265 [Undibacterium sp. SXout11W]|uniref:hypothetical protein n=1 Tax=Undibacterium sp. SXout11W TaxID=3413050 RepID=UPI003BF21047
MNVKILFDGTNCCDLNTQAQLTVAGSSPYLLQGLFKFFRREAPNIKTVNLAFFIFNNKLLHDELNRLALEFDIEINVISIPLEGYDHQKRANVYDLTGITVLRTGVTKKELAAEVYDEFTESTVHEKYKLFIFPHIYVRSKSMKFFSRGALPYSLHIKSIHVVFRDDCRSSVMLSSSNFAVRDQTKSEFLVRVDDDQAISDSSRQFFELLISNSIPVKKFTENFDSFKFNINKFLTQSIATNANLFGAPFLKNSQVKIKSRIIDLIINTKRRLYISAQHLSAFQKPQVASKGKPFDYPNQILNYALDLPSEIEVHFLSQTFVDEFGNSHGCNRPENESAFKDFIGACVKKGRTSYFANKVIHWKFIVSDDIVVLTTCNFTPTQFIYIEDVRINRFDSHPELSYFGIHSEVGQFLIFENSDIAAELIAEFEKCSFLKDTVSLDKILAARW